MFGVVVCVFVFNGRMSDLFFCRLWFYYLVFDGQWGILVQQFMFVCVFLQDWVYVSSCRKYGFESDFGLLVQV